ncbi:MAG: hypothetical protein Q8K57_07230 [Thiobacillus sp.]|nr:hypothetical protein [Thiobacillus sp.]MDP3125009.1 hypothetical protein [Thiobacillus sp.]
MRPFVIHDRCGWDTLNLVVMSGLRAALTVAILIERPMRQVAAA